MSLRARLTLIYGGLLALVFVVLGWGAQIVMQGRFADETRTALVSNAQRVYRESISPGQTLQADGSGWEFPVLPTENAVRTPGIYFEILDPAGAVAERSPATTNLPINMAAVHGALLHLRTSFHTAALSGDHLEVYYSPLMILRRPNRQAEAVLVVAKSQADIRRALDVFSASLYGGEALLWLVVVGVTWLVAGSALRPIAGMTAQAASIAATRDFAGRVHVDSSAAELQRLALTFNKMLASLQEAYAGQQRFLADASHELRTPLTVVQGNLHYLQDAPDAPARDRQEALQAARLEADRMGVLVAGLLALSQADAGQTIRRVPVELDRVVVDAFRRIQTRERSRTGSAVSLRLGRLDEAVVRGDYDRLLQLVMILLDNGVKYTPSGGEVTIELARDQRHVVTIRVEDTGVGIPMEDREHIFERFFRSNSARLMGEGSGLGLPIAEWIAEEHGGTIEFHDNANGGTTFIVALPIQTAPDAPPPVTDSVSGGRSHDSADVSRPESVVR